MTFMTLLYVFGNKNKTEKTTVHFKIISNKIGILQLLYN